MNERGFTLIEVLVSLVLTGLVAVLAYGALSSTIAASESTDDEARRLQSLEQAFRLLQRDIAQVVVRPVFDNYGERQAVFSGGRAGEPLMSFTRAGWHNARGQQRSRLQRVDYRLENNRLWRDYWFNADRSPVDEPVSVELLSDLVGMRIRFLDGSAGTPGADSNQWRESWLARDAADRIPAAVEIVLELEVWGEVRRLFVLPANG